MTFLPADCKDRYVTAQHLLKVGKRGGERRLRSDSKPLRSHLLSMLTFQSVLYHVRVWFENVPLTLWFWGWPVENRFECVSCFLGCLGFPNQTWIDPDILYKSQACACAQVYTKIPKWIQDSKIKTSNSLFHLVCLEFFHLVFTPGQNYASCFAISSPLICLGHCLLFYQYTGELSLQLCILPSVGFHSSGTTIWTRTKQLCSNVGQRADMSAAYKIRHSTKTCHDMPALRWCCKPQEITDEQIQDIKHAMGQVAVSLRRMRWSALNRNIICVFLSAFT